MSDFSDIQYVIAITSEVHSGCQECREWRNPPDFSARTVAAVANHYVKEHGYRILHVGQEMAYDREGIPRQATIIVVGTTDRSKVERHAAESARAFEEFMQGDGIKPEQR